MQIRTQLGTRENPASAGQHGSRFAALGNTSAVRFRHDESNTHGPALKTISAESQNKALAQRPRASGSSEINTLPAVPFANQRNSPAVAAFDDQPPQQFQPPPHAAPIRAATAGETPSGTSALQLTTQHPPTHNPLLIGNDEGAVKQTAQACAASPNHDRVPGAHGLATVQGTTPGESASQHGLSGLHHADGAEECPAATLAPPHRLLTIREVAELLQVPVSWVYTRTRKRTLERLPGYRLGKYWRFDRDEILVWVARHKSSREAA